MNWKKIGRALVCLVLVCCILVNASPIKAQAIAIESAVAIGCAAILTLFSCGVVFSPQNQTDIVNIGKSFSRSLYGYDFILIAQSDRQLDRQIRYCIEQEDKHYKLANFNWFGWILAKLSGGNLFVVHKSWYGFHGTRNGTDVLRYKRKVASIYDTHYKF